MPSSGMVSRVTLVSTDVSEEGLASIFMVTIMGELGTKAVIPSSEICGALTVGAATFPRNVGSYKSHTV
jgi:hypothetical protein